MELIARSYLKADALALTNSTDTRLERMRNMFSSWTNALQAMPPKPDRRHLENLRVRGAVRAADEGDPYARKACFEAAARFLNEGLPLPPCLAQYIAKFCTDASQSTSNSKKTGVSYFKNLDRDLIIGGAIAVLVEEAGICATRGPEHQHADSNHISACALIAKLLPEFGLKLSESGVETVWKTYAATMLPEPEYVSWNDGNQPQMLSVRPWPAERIPRKRKKAKPSKTKK